jgi:hypothetical protein
MGLNCSTFGEHGNCMKMLVKNSAERECGSPISVDGRIVLKC